MIDWLLERFFPVPSPLVGARTPDPAPATIDGRALWAPRGLDRCRRLPQCSIDLTDGWCHTCRTFVDPPRTRAVADV